MMSESVDVEPSSFEEEVQQLVWVDAMVEEYDSIIRNNVWEVVPRPTDKLVVSSRWIYKVKEATDGSVEKYKRHDSVGLWYKWTEGVKLQAFTNADWVGSPSDKKNTSGGIFSIGTVAVSSYNRKQRSVALSVVEVEYMDASQETCEAIWMRKILVGLLG
eukprot:PITA_24761